VTAEWRQHPLLRSRFLPEHPDDLQVIVHDGGPRLTPARPEAVWVTVTAMDGEVFRGRVLNEPQQLARVKRGDEITFMVPAGAPHPILVTEKYLRERGAWTVHPCDKCGLSELFDAPSELVGATFKGLPPDAQPEMFTAFCPLCGGGQVVELKAATIGEPAPPTGVVPVSRARPWWRFWG
jgi:hypothetical protein